MLKTDAQIQSEVQDELRLAPMVNATHIGVEVRQGVVTLTGHVDSYGEKMARRTSCPTRWQR